MKKYSPSLSIVSFHLQNAIMFAGFPENLASNDLFADWVNSLQDKKPSNDTHDPKHAPLL